MISEFTNIWRPGTLDCGCLFLTNGCVPHVYPPCPCRAVKPAGQSTAWHNRVKCCCDATPQQRKKGLTFGWMSPSITRHSSSHVSQDFMPHASWTDGHLRSLLRSQDVLAAWCMSVQRHRKRAGEDCAAVAGAYGPVVKSKERSRWRRRSA
jgi:hypothetical protein